jgi:hypothetical protein
VADLSSESVLMDTRRDKWLIPNGVTAERAILGASPIESHIFKQSLTAVDCWGKTVDFLMGCANISATVD